MCGGAPANYQKIPLGSVTSRSETLQMHGEPGGYPPRQGSPGPKRGFREALKESPSRPDGKFIRAIDDNVVHCDAEAQEGFEGHCASAARFAEHAQFARVIDAMTICGGA